MLGQICIISQVFTPAVSLQMFIFLSQTATWQRACDGDEVETPL